MKLTQLGANQTQVENRLGYILYSYEIPVAFWSKDTGALSVTSKKHSTTTSKHINKWVAGRKFTSVDQLQINALAL